MRKELRRTTVIGYLAPVSEPSEARTAHFYTTRYALAPVLVVDSVDQSLIVADGVTGIRNVPPGLIVRRDFGGGLALLERVARQP